MRRIFGKLLYFDRRDVNCFVSDCQHEAHAQSGFKFVPHVNLLSIGLIIGIVI